MASTLKIALVQSPLHWEDPPANRKLFEEKIKAIPNPVDLIVLPEMFSTGFTMNPQHVAASEGIKTVAWMQEMAQQKEAALVGSIAFWEKDKPYNRLFFVPPDGTLTTYDKKHLFTLAGEDTVYEAGTQKVTVNYRGFVLRPLICYDLRFPVWSRNVEEYELLLYVANWPASRITAWDTLLKARAIENMAYCIGVNRIGVDALGYTYPGHSAVYDALGRPVAYSEREEVLYASLEKQHLAAARNALQCLEDRDRFILTE